MAGIGTQLESRSLPEIFNQNTELRQEIKDLKSLVPLHIQEAGNILGDSREEYQVEGGQSIDKESGYLCERTSILSQIRRAKIFLVLVLLVIVLGVIGIVNVYSLHQLGSGTILHNLFPREHLSIGFRTDPNLQECQQPEMKRSFPDLDYALLGYNILRGYPLAVGHDPGFTFPIFRADYSYGGQTADCRYSVPRGLFLVPDVSCVTSFTSKIVQTQYELHKTLSTSANVQGGGWGRSFSASTGYKQSSSVVSNGKSIVVYSTANCNYYYSKLEKGLPPPFSAGFLDSLSKLNSAVEGSSGADKNIFWDFLEYYGTHFLTEATFGASFTYEHRLSSSAYSHMQEKGVDVAVSASYSGLFSAGGGFHMDSSQKNQASAFRSQVQTRTITIGAAPPSNGDAMTWASTVKETPVPTRYTLSSIEDLFTEEYMGSLNINYVEIGNRIKSYKGEYCEFLREMGDIDNCDQLQEGIVLPETELLRSSRSESLSRSSCIEACLQRLGCVAISFCRACKPSDPMYNTCYMYDEGKSKAAKKNAQMETTIVLPKIKKQLVLNETIAIGRTRSSHKTTRVEDCLQKCLNDAHCVALSFCKCPHITNNCNLYGESGILRLERQTGTKTYLISSLVNSVQEIYPTTPRPTTVQDKP